MPDRIDKALRKLTQKEREAVKAILAALSGSDTEHLDIKKLRGRDDIFRVRKGNIRIIYQVHLGKISILFIGRRSDTTYNE